MSREINRYDYLLSEVICYLYILAIGGRNNPQSSKGTARLHGTNFLAAAFHENIEKTRNSMDPIADDAGLDTSNNSNDGSETSFHDVNSSTDNEYTNATAEVRKATKGEDRSVFWSSLLVKVTKVAVAISLTLLVFNILKRSELKQFQASVSIRFVNDLTTCLVCAKLSYHTHHIRRRFPWTVQHQKSNSRIVCGK
jgi:hypothetical protein